MVGGESRKFAIKKGYALGDLTKCHTDHALPIYHGGTNKYSNLVLSHAGCNMKKWVRIDATPNWIKDARATAKRKRERKALHKEQRIAALRIIDEYILETELWWLRDEREGGCTPL